VQAGRMVLKQMRSITDKPVTHVFNTHIHGDHWLGNQAIVEAFPEAVLMGHPQMIAKARGGEDERWVAMMEQLTEGFTRGTKAVIPEKSVADADVIQINGKTFRIYAPGKAHSGTDIMIEFVEESVVFLGDNVLNERIARMDDATFRGSIQACQVAIDLKAAHYVPGHGQTGDVSVPMNYKRYLGTLYAEVGRLYDEGMSDFEMKPGIVKMLVDYRDWSGFGDEVGKHISLAVLETEQSMFE
jgi:glyoxylase-like metal-dependent hydrolase (beta-lactamase superfamily II)